MMPVRTGIRKREKRPANSGARLLLYGNLFDSSKNLPGLFPVKTVSYPTIVIRFWIIKVLNEDLQHLWIIMSAGVNKDPGMIFSNLPGYRSARDKPDPASTIVTIFTLLDTGVIG